MAGDHTSDWQIASGLAQSVWTQTIAIKERGRITLPVAVRNLLPWTKQGGTYLSVLGGDGSVRVQPWEGNGTRIVQALKERCAALPPHEQAELALAAMDRFQKFTGEKGGRMTLPSVIRSQVDPSGLNIVRVVVRECALYLWDDVTWGKSRVSRIARLEAEGILAPN